MGLDSPAQEATLDSLISWARSGRLFPHGSGFKVRMRLSSYKRFIHRPVPTPAIRASAMQQLDDRERGEAGKTQQAPFGKAQAQECPVDGGAVGRTQDQYLEGLQK